MLVPERRRRVLEHVRRHGSAQVQHLADALGVSAWTVRRDLDELARQGLLSRTHGGAFVELDPAPRLTAPPEPANHAAKTRIAAVAASRIADDTTVMVLGGSTTAGLVEHLAHRRLTVVTNGLEVAYSLRHAPDVSLIVLGGYLHREQLTLLGPLTEQTMAGLHVDLIVAGAYGVDPEVGVTGSKIIQAGYHHTMLRHSDSLMVLADAGKLNRRGPTVLAGIDDVDVLITDTDAPDATVRRLRERGPEVVLA